MVARDGIEPPTPANVRIASDMFESLFGICIYQAVIE
jgi:hypothetical protein